MTVLAATNWKTNADLIVDCVKLGYLRKEWITADVTYGRGRWWSKWQPDVLIKHDLYTVDGVDFRDLPEDTGSLDVVAYDPPYTCASSDTEILTAQGWKFHHELLDGEMILTLDHGSGLSEWKPLTRVNRYLVRDEPMLSMEGRSHSSLTTMDHRWPVLRRRKGHAYCPEWATSESFMADDTVPTAMPHVFPEDPVVSDAMVELLAWFWCEGSLERRHDGTRGNYGHICQSHEANPENVERIRRCLTEVFGRSVDRFPRVGRSTDGVLRWRESIDGNNTRFWFSVDVGSLIRRYVRPTAPHPVTGEPFGLAPTMEFIRSLTKAQAHLFLETAIDADGWRRDDQRFAAIQRDEASADAFQVLGVLCGFAPSISRRRDGCWVILFGPRGVFKPSRNRPQVVHYTGVVWCPTVENETWLARRKGRVHWTGNCKGGRETSGIEDFDDAYGLERAPATPAELQQMINDGLTEVHRVVAKRGVALVKCSSYVSSGKLWLGDYLTMSHALALGFQVQDILRHVGTARPQPARTRKDGRPVVQGHARQNYSTLLVLRKV